MPDIFDTPLMKAHLAALDAQASAKPRGNRPASRRNEQRMYSAARSSRLTNGFNPASTSADAELSSSHTMLRNRSRALVRDASYAKRAKMLVMNNVIGCGIGMQAQVMTTRDQLNDRVNDDIEEVWKEWCEAENCHTGGRLGFCDFERNCMGQVFEAGEVLIRKHYRPFGTMGLPFAMELIESERLAEDFVSLQVNPATGNQIRMGVEVDEFYRPVAYYLRKRHPNDLRWIGQQSDQVERVPAEQIIHLAVVDRWPQTRGEPWLHTAARRLNDMDGYSEAEITRARVQALTVGAIETPEGAEDLGEQQEDGTYETELQAGTLQRLNPGEKLNASPVNAPNPALDPFMRYMLREVCAGAGPSYESVSRDYSQSNYSSSRLALLDDRDLWRVIQSWFIRTFRSKIHREWIRQAVYSRKLESIRVEEYALNTRKFEAVLFKPRGWTWIDPTKEVEAYEKAIVDGMTTLTDVIAQTAGGMDIEDVLKIRERELKLMKEKGLVFMTSPEVYTAPATKAQAAEKPPPDKPDEPSEEPDNAPPRAGRVVFGVVKNGR